MDTTNLWIYPDENHNLHLKNMEANPKAPMPIVYVSFPSTKDPLWSKNFPGKSTIELVVPAPYEWFAEWDGSKWRKRGSGYEEFKDELAQRMLEILFKRMPQLRGKIDFYEVSTPLSTKYFCGYEKGEIYGINHDPKRFQNRALRAHTPIKNLYLTGQDVVTCGVGGALISGVLSTIAILGLRKSLNLLRLLSPVKRTARA